MNTTRLSDSPVFDMIRAHLDIAPAVQMTAGDLLAQALALPAEKRTQLFDTLLGAIDTLDDDADTPADSASQLALDWSDLLATGYLEADVLVPDGDTERLLARQKDLMDTCFEGVGEETIPRKQAGLARQQFQLEQMHALRLTLCYSAEAELQAHLARALDDPSNGYGPFGDHGRTIAQGLRALANEDGYSFAEAAARWFRLGDSLRRQVFAGVPLSLRPLFDETGLDSFLPVLTRVDDHLWRLGSAAQGKHRDFKGDLRTVWTDIVQTLAGWTTADNEAWLASVKQKALRLPYSLQRVAWANRLLKEKVTVERDGSTLAVHIDRLPANLAWPQFINFGAAVGLTRLSGHGLYELMWVAGGPRHFELNSTRRHKIPWEHTEIAVAMADVLAGDARPDPASPQEIEAAFLFRMKAKGVELLPPPESVPLVGVEADGVGSYKVGDVTATILQHKDLAIYAEKGDTAIVLQRNVARGELVVKPVVRGRIRGAALLATPLADIGRSAAWTRALCAWACWLVWAVG